jgi:hypothetical protein
VPRIPPTLLWSRRMRMAVLLAVAAVVAVAVSRDSALGAGPAAQPIAAENWLVPVENATAREMNEDCLTATEWMPGACCIFWVDEARSFVWYSGFGGTIVAEFHFGVLSAWKVGPDSRVRFPPPGLVNRLRTSMTKGEVERVLAEEAGTRAGRVPPQWSRRLLARSEAASARGYAEHQAYDFDFSP